mmetsp:Transcript_28203/g.91130  ORF Transcript_28203/g.91130 Transcript_28203/m.91130 type:complete len:327 (+) Transcript_28203:140-1120(+)
MLHPWRSHSSLVALRHRLERPASSRTRRERMRVAATGNAEGMARSEASVVYDVNGCRTRACLGSKCSWITLSHTRAQQQHPCQLVHGTQRTPMPTRLLDAVQILHDHVVQDGIVVAQIAHAHAQVDVLHQVHLGDALAEVLDAAVLEVPAHQLGTRGQVLAHAVQHRVSGILDTSQLVHALLLHTHSEVVAILDARDAQLDPHLGSRQHLHGLRHVVADHLDHAKKAPVAWDQNHVLGCASGRSCCVCASGRSRGSRGGSGRAGTGRCLTTAALALLWPAGAALVGRILVLAVAAAVAIAVARRQKRRAIKGLHSVPVGSIEPREV